jgi:hypothetical protein
MYYDFDEWAGGRELVHTMPVSGVSQPNVSLVQRKLNANVEMLTGRLPRFPIADVLWTTAMAVNVYLIVYRSYDIESLRRLEWKYMVGITTVTFIPALVLLFIRNEENGPMYGSVTVRIPPSICSQPLHSRT